MAFLPSSYADTLQPAVTCNTSLDELQSLIVNLYNTHISRETIAGIESARRVTSSPSNTPSPKTLTPPPLNQTNWNGSGPRGGRGKHVRSQKLAATRSAGFEQWRAMALHTLNLNDCANNPNGPALAVFRAMAHHVEHQHPAATAPTTPESGPDPGYHVLANDVSPKL
ncbi:hypothetical protein JCM1840_000631 [Sporobolomyces johnsonii]